MGNRLFIIPFQPEMLAEVALIEAASDPEGWERAEFNRQLGRQYRCKVAVESHCRIVRGFSIYQRLDTGYVILKLCVDPLFRREGIGRRLRNSFAAALTERHSEVECYVAENNLAGQLFLREGGYQAESLIKGGHPKTREDVYVMRLRLKPLPKAGFFVDRTHQRLTSSQWRQRDGQRCLGC